MEQSRESDLRRKGVFAMRVLLSVFLSVCLCQMALARNIVVSVKADLATTRAAAGDIVYLQGYLNPGDGGGQTLYYSTAGGTVDNGFIFDAPGAGNERFIAVERDTADPAKFGAVAGANSTVTADAFQAAINTGVAVVNLDSSKTWTIDDGLENPNGVPMNIAGVISYEGTAEPIVTIGTVTANGESGRETFLNGREFRLKLQRTSPTSTSTADGLKIINCVDGHFYVNVKNCQAGIYLLGSGSSFGSCSRNQFWLGNINNCETGIHLEATGTAGYSNENTFYGGEIDTYSGAGGMNTANVLKGVFLEFNGDAGTAHYIDGNRFIGQSIELYNQNETPLKVLFYADYSVGVRAAQENMFIAFRMENAGQPISQYRLVGGRGLVSNKFESNFLISTTNIAVGKSLGDEMDLIAFNNFHLRHEDNDYVRLASIHPRQMVNTASGATAPPHGVLISGAGGEAFNQVLSEVTVTATEITINTPSNWPKWVGIPIDMTLSAGTGISTQVHDMSDRVVHVQYTLSEAGGRVLCRCYNADKTTIEDDPEDCSLGPFLGSSHQYFYLDAVAGTDGSARPFILPIAFGPDVAYAIIGIGQTGSASTEDTHLKHFDIYAKKNSGFRLLNDDGTINTMSGSTRYPIFHETEMPRSTVVPTSTECLHGTLVRNTSESELGAGVPVFWRFDKLDGVWDEVGP